MIPAMLCFSNLVDNEKTKIATTLERNLISDIILQGRIEQFLRHGSKSDPMKDPQTLLRVYLQSNEFYSSVLAANSLCHPQLLWAATVLGDIRLCYPDIVFGLFLNQENFNLALNEQSDCFWKLVFCDWRAVYMAPSKVFSWIRDLLLSQLVTINRGSLNLACEAILPWRRELLRKFFCDVPDVADSVDYTEITGNSKTNNDEYMNTLIHVILEIIKRGEDISYHLPSFFYNWQARKIRRKTEAHLADSPIESSLFATSCLNHFAASPSHCVCIRNGRLYSWGDGRLGRLGIKTSSDKSPSILEVPFPVNISPNLKIVIESVSCGQTHCLALTSEGTVLAFGSNKYGQLGVGRQCLFSEYPVFPDHPNVTFLCIAAGGYHSVAIDHVNRVWTWGWGIFGQLGGGEIENKHYPTPISINEKIVKVSAGHSHTALLTINGKVFTFGCSHFGQLGHGISTTVKLKIPKRVKLPPGVLVKSIECGLSSTIFLTIRNRIFYTGINPSSIRSMLSGARRRVVDGHPVPAVDAEEKDYTTPVLIDTTHIAGEIIKIDAAMTHFAVLTSNGLVYSWGLGKNGQLMRADDEKKGLEQIDYEFRAMIASNVVCTGECSWVEEKDTGKLFGYGFNSSGQLGRMEPQKESSILTIKTNKRVLRIRQPANVHFKPKEIIGLPKISEVATLENSISPQIDILPPSNCVDQKLLNWILKTFYKVYDASYIASLCAEFENHEAAAVVYQLQKNYENVLEQRLAYGSNGCEDELIMDYIETKEKEANCLEETRRFIDILIRYWIRKELLGSELESILMPYYRRHPWNSYISLTLRDMISETNDRSKWIARSFTPSFILACIRDSKNAKLDDSYWESRRMIAEQDQNNFTCGKVSAVSHNGVSSKPVMDNGSDTMC